MADGFNRYAEAASTANKNLPAIFRATFARKLLATFSKLGYYVRSFPDCSGGNSRPSRPSGAGGGTFFFTAMSNAPDRPALRNQLLANSALSRHRSLVGFHHSRSGRISWPVALTLMILIISGLLLFVFWRLETWPVRTAHQSSAELERLGRELRSAFVDVAHLQPRIKINDRVYLEQTIPTSELVVLSRRVEVEHELQHTWAGSSKRVKLHGTFLVKAGFDLRQDLSVDIRPEAILVRMPHAEILGVEQQQVDLLEFENGYW